MAHFKFANEPFFVKVQTGLNLYHFPIIARCKMGKFIRKHIYLVFILPALIWIGVFTIYPFFYSFYISVTDLNLLRMGTEEIIGMKNYAELFQNKDFIHSCVVSLKFSAVVVVGQFTLGFALAFLFQKKRPFSGIGRTSVILPWVVPPVALGLMWKWILRSGKMGLLNAVLIQLGGSPKDWLGSNMALTTLMFVTVWIGVPFTFMLEMAGLQKIPGELYEAGAIDGANGFQKFIYLTIPMMKSTFLINLIMITIGTIGYFDIIYALTGGGPKNATEVLPLYMYNSAFKFHQLGQGAAMAVIMLLISLILTVVYMFVFKGESEE